MSAARDPQGRWLVGYAAVVLLAVGTLVTLLVPDWDAPWDGIETEEWGWRGIAMDTFSSDRTRQNPWNVLPAAIEPVEDAGVPASEVYENLEVLGDLDASQFDRLMQAITEWVSPEQGCAYCHNLEQGFANDDLYTKVVARQMLLMVQELNANHPQHIGETGVTCYTCHRGQTVPPYHWFNAAEVAPPMGGIVGTPPAWVRTADNIRDFLPRDSFTNYLLEDHPITGSQPRAVAVGQVSDLNKMEDIYLLMMQVSDALGVNCSFCHNSRAFWDWEQSTPKRITGWYAIRNVREINRDWIQPIGPLLPKGRLGPVGDPPKVDCMTCHVGNQKPLGGAPMADDFPGLHGPAAETAEEAALPPSGTTAPSGG